MLRRAACFFFSSRRRHTRYWRDWSSDVCSSDLAAEAEIERLERELQLLLLPKDPNEGKDVIVEIRGAEGGEEANLFARDLFNMYEGFASRRGRKLEVRGASESSVGGFDAGTCKLSG